MMAAFRFEWVIIDVLILAFLIYELVSVRRCIRRDKAAKQASETDNPPG
jgi:hypothetical protein